MNTKNFLTQNLGRAIVSLSLSGVLAFSGLIGMSTSVHAANVTQSSIVSSTTIHPTSVSLNKTSDTITKDTFKVGVGGKDTLSVTITPASATNKNVIWTSSNTKVVTVNAGVIKAVSAGTATITVTSVDGSKTDTCSVTVNPVVHPTSISLSKTSDSIKMGGKDTLTSTITSVDATNKNIIWITSNKKIATVSDGVITAKSPGTVKIIAYTADKCKFAICSVTIY